jgi:sialate O-acetylesterase
MIQLASLFQDHAILQRDTPIPCWGWTEPRTAVVIRFAESEVHCMSNERGDFFAKLPAMSAGGPFSLQVTTPANGASISKENLLVGEVWLASGQSNMELATSDCGDYGKTVLNDADSPHIRFFSVGQRAQLGRQAMCGGHWQACTPATAHDFFAVGFTFARKLHHSLNVPIGVICSVWGGMPIEAWMSEPALADLPDTQEALAAYHTLHSPHPSAPSGRSSSYQPP